jgi:hypothetical protein
MAGGSRFMRNPALPLNVRGRLWERGVAELCSYARTTAPVRACDSASPLTATCLPCLVLPPAPSTFPTPQIVFPPDIFPEGVPPEYNIASQDVNYIQVPMSSQPEGMKTVMIDVMKKTAE